MSEYRFAMDVDRKTYDDFVKASPYCNLLQSYAWGDVKKSWKHFHTGVYDENGSLAAAGLVLVRSLPLHTTMFYLPRGPIMDYKNEELVVFYFQNLKKLAKIHHAVMIKFDPCIHVNDYRSDEYNENRYPDTEEYLRIFRKAGALHRGFTTYIEETAQARLVSNVYKTDDLEGSLPKHTKRLIKDADRHHVKVVYGGKEYLDEFSRLVKLTEARKKVDLRNEEYFQLLMDTYGDDAVIFLAVCNVCQLYQEALAKKEDLVKQMDETPDNAVKKKRRLTDQLNSVNKEIKEFEPILDEIGHEDKDIAIAGILSIQYGNTCEMLYAGMDQRFHQFMPQYKAYVENFRWAFDRGCEYADMGGVEGTLDDGLTKFKDNFNPIINEFIGEFDIPVNHLLYRPVAWAYKKKKEKALAEVKASAEERANSHKS